LLSGTGRRTREKGDDQRDFKRDPNSKQNAEKIDDPRLLRIGRKDTQKDDQRLKLKNGAI
jgi:hypothetical protein